MCKRAEAVHLKLEKVFVAVKWLGLSDQLRRSELREAHFDFSLARAIRNPSRIASRNDLLVSSVHKSERGS